MDPNLRGLFERAFDDEPAPPGDLARDAIAQGVRLRRRRHLLGGTAAAVSLAVAAAGAVNLAEPPAGPAAGPAPAPSANCSPIADRWASSVSIFLRSDVTQEQRAAVATALDADRRVRGYRHETREEAFEKFKVLWRDDEDFVGSVEPDSLPEAFRVELARPAEYAVFRTAVGRLDGVQDIVGSTC